MGYSRKNPHPHNGRHAEKFSQEGGLTALEIQTGGVLEHKDKSSGVTFNFIDVSIASIDKKKIALRFPILLFFQTTDFLTHLF